MVSKAIAKQAQTQHLQNNRKLTSPEAIRARCSSFAAFVREAWPILEPNQPLIWGWHLDAVCEHLEAVTAGRIKYLLINIPPGTMKSLLISVFWPAWEWGPAGRPGLRYLTTSYEISLAIRDSTKMRRLVTSKWYRDAWGDQVRLQGDQNAKDNFGNTNGGIREARAFGSTTGARGDRVIVDDPHSVVQAESEKERSSAVQTFKEAILSRTNSADSAFVVVMQRVHTDDLSGTLLGMDLPLVHLNLPMEFETDRRCTTGIGFRDPRTKPGEILSPELFPPERIRMLKTMGSYAWAGQYQQRPVPRDGGIFKRENFQFVRALPHDVVHRIRGWDLAASEQSQKNSDPDWTASVRMSRDSTGRFFIENARRFRGTPGAVERAIKSEAEADPYATEIELPQDPGGAGKAWAQQIVKRLAGWTARATPVQGNKEQRATPLAAQIEVGNVLILRTGDEDDDAWIKPFVDELCQFPTGSHDDLVDAASAAFNALALPMMKSQGAFEHARRMADRAQGRLPGHVQSTAPPDIGGAEVAETDPRDVPGTYQWILARLERAKAQKAAADLPNSEEDPGR